MRTKIKGVLVFQVLVFLVLGLRSPQSVSNLLVLLSRFQRCAGLKINVSKSEMLWLGSMTNRKDGILNFQISEEPVYTLRTYFSRTVVSYQTRDTSSINWQNYRIL